MKDQNTVAAGTPTEKWNRGLDLFVESVPNRIMNSVTVLAISIAMMS